MSHRKITIFQNGEKFEASVEKRCIQIFVTLCLHENKRFFTSFSNSFCLFLLVVLNSRMRSDFFYLPQKIAKPKSKHTLWVHAKFYSSHQMVRVINRNQSCASIHRNFDKLNWLSFSSLVIIYHHFMINGKTRNIKHCSAKRKLSSFFFILL